MRIVGGEYRGRTLSSPSGLKTRPTSDRARQAVFNIIEHASWRTRDLLEGADVRDAFAGTGALGREALSRGARHGVFIEKDFNAVRACEENIKNLSVEDRTLVMKQDALKVSPRPMYVAPRTLVFLDPPYGMGLGEKALTVLLEKDWLDDDAVCVLEMAKKDPEKIPQGFKVFDERDYGVARVCFLGLG